MYKSDEQMTKNAVVYTRVSSTEQVDNFSLDSQADACMKMAQDQGYTILKTFRDEGISAKDTNRPELQDMLAYCRVRSNQVSAVYVYSLSRLNRNTLDFLTIKSLLAKFGVSILSVTEPNSETPEGDFIKLILSGAAELDNKIKGRTVTVNMRKRFLEGFANCRPPIGYMPGVVNGRSNPVPDPETYDTVQSTWLRIDKEKLTLAEVVSLWNKLGLKMHNKPFKKWYMQTVSKIFTSKFYAGILTSDKYPDEPIGMHQSMIDLDTYYRVRQIISGRDQNKGERKAFLREDFPLRQILRCPLCNKKMTSFWSQGKNGKFAYYACPSRGVHPYLAYPVKKVEDKFEELLRLVQPTPERMAFFTELMEEKYNQRFAQLKLTSKTVSKDVIDLQDTLKTLKYKHLKGVYNDSEFMEMRDDLEAQIAVKKGIGSEMKLEVLDIKAILAFMTYYLTHLDVIFGKASTKGKFVLGCSIFPDGVAFENEAYRTPRLGLAYALTNDVLTSISPSVALNTLNANTIDELIRAYQLLHRDVLPYVHV